MIVRVSGIKAWVYILLGLLVVIIILALLFQLLIFLLPLILIIALVSYLFRKLNKLKKEPTKEVMDVKFRVKK